MCILRAYTTTIIDGSTMHNMPARLLTCAAFVTVLVFMTSFLGLASLAFQQLWLAWYCLQTELYMSDKFVHNWTLAAGQLTSGQLTLGQLTLGQLTLGQLTLGQLTLGQLTLGHPAPRHLTADIAHTLLWVVDNCNVQ